MPELQHECGKRVKFPPGTEGRRGKCPHCGGAVNVPLGPSPHAQKEHTLDPPDHWEDYVAYLEDRGPPPRPLVMPMQLMLKTEADEKWDSRKDVRPSKFACPACRMRMNVNQIVCTKCGLDFRTGYVLGQQAKVNEKGMIYLAGIPWLEEAREELKAEKLKERMGKRKKSKSGSFKKKKTGKFPAKRKKRW
ncbi:hypothetical protein OAX78_03975 [Planctomycetota bacterium]|nr:hypothetical protein [Planctomycetota bacterium]